MSELNHVFGNKAPRYPPSHSGTVDHNGLSACACAVAAGSETGDPIRLLAESRQRHSQPGITRSHKAITEFESKLRMQSSVNETENRFSCRVSSPTAAEDGGTLSEFESYPVGSAKPLRRATTMHTIQTR